MSTLNWAFTIVRKINEQGHLRRRTLEAEKAQLKLEIAQKASRIRAIEKELKSAAQA